MTGLDLYSQPLVLGIACRVYGLTHCAEVKMWNIALCFDLQFVDVVLFDLVGKYLEHFESSYAAMNLSSVLLRTSSL